MPGEILRQDREIALHVAGRDAGGLAREAAGASSELRRAPVCGRLAGNGGNLPTPPYRSLRPRHTAPRP